MATINTNMAANIAANALTRNERTMGSTMERLSTGLRINSAKDDAAGLAISSKMTSQIHRFESQNRKTTQKNRYPKNACFSTQFFLDFCLFLNFYYQC